MEKKLSADRISTIVQFQFDVAVGKFVGSDSNREAAMIRAKIFEGKAMVFGSTAACIDHLYKRVCVFPTFAERDTGNGGQYCFSILVDQLKIPPLKIVCPLVFPLKYFRSPNFADSQ